MNASKKTATREVREVVLVVDAQDVMVKIFVAGIWKKRQAFSGFTYSTGLELDAAAAFSKHKLPLKAELREDKHTVDVNFLRPVGYKQKYVYELQLLLNESCIRKIGPIQIIDWPKEDLGEIHFLRKAGMASLF